MISLLRFQKIIHKFLSILTKLFPILLEKAKKAVIIITAFSMYFFYMLIHKIYGDDKAHKFVLQQTFLN